MNNKREHIISQYKQVCDLYNTSEGAYKDCMGEYKTYMETAYGTVIHNTQNKICGLICEKCFMEYDEDCDLCYGHTIYEEDTIKKD